MCGWLRGAKRRRKIGPGPPGCYDRPGKGLTVAAEEEEEKPAKNPGK